MKASRPQRLLILGIGLGLGVLTAPVVASPFGQGVYGADVPFGALTSISVALGGNVSLNLAPSGPNFSGNGSHTITVTSTDVVGYMLYVWSPNSTNMVNGGSTIAASANSSPGALAANTWGYNVTGSSTNFKGMTTAPVIIKDANGPHKNGDDTTVTYGALTDASKAAGTYTISVVYTIVAKNQ